MKTTQNIIHSSAFNFEYGSKASAIKGNGVIESIFYSHILPEIEAAISKKIPEGVLIELAKLEINIGTIKEKNLAKDLAGQIRASLEKALDFKLDIAKELNGGGQTLNGQKSGNFIITSIEIFLTKGYFPYALERELSINELVTTAIQNYKSGFLSVLKKHRNRDNVIRRTAFSLNQQTFDKIVFTLEPVSADWIIGFRKTLLLMKKEINLNHYNETEFIQLLNYSILKYLLNDTSSSFNTKRFSSGILSDFSHIFEPFSKRLIHREQNTTQKSETALLIEATLIELQGEIKNIYLKDGSKEIPLEQLVKIVNSGHADFSVFSSAFLKSEILRSIQDKEKRAVLVKNLREKGAIFILELFNKDKVQKLHKLIEAFTEKIGGKADKSQTVNQLVLQTVMYLQEEAIRELDNEEFILFLIYSAGLDETKTIQNPAFQNFIQNQENINLKKISAVLNEEQKFHQISSIQKVLSAEQKQQEVTEYLTIHIRKIIGYFLDSGYLPPEYENLSKSDVQQIFIDLLKEKDDFLVVHFKTNEDAQLLLHRLKILIDKNFSDSLNDYLIHFFQNEYSILTRTIAGLSQEFTFKTNRIQSNLFLEEIFTTALAESKGGDSSAVFSFFILEHLNTELAKDAIEPDEFRRFLLAKLGETLEIKTTPTKDELSGMDSGLLFNLLQQGKLELNDAITKKLKHLWILLKNNKQFQSAIKQPDKQIKVSQPSNDDLSTESYKTAETKTDIPKDLDFYISVLTFYAQKGIFPWWAAPISINGLISKLQEQSRLMPQEFEELVLQAENQEHIFDQLMHQLPADAIKDMSAIFAKHSTLKETWEKSLHKKKHKENSSDSQVDETTERIKNSKLDIDEFIHEAYKDENLLFKGLYFFTDDAILNRWLAKSPQVAAQIREYLSITPYFYYRNVTPPKWRQAVFDFSMEYYAAGSNTYSTHFHNEFLSYLKKRHGGSNWVEILTNVYRVIQSTGNKYKATFPTALIRLLNINENSRTVTDNTDSKDNMEIADDSGIETKISNAGLILLWPFLTRLFEHLSLVKQGVFVNSESMNRAVYILQYLVYNETDFPEYELVLNKLLVGMQLNVHLEPFVTLTDEEKNMTKSLLNGFMSNWEKVKNSTPEGVQETFLQRDGMLRFKDQEVVLKVEKKGVDVLLGSIPWNFSVVKLSWMKKPIHVEWI